MVSDAILNLERKYFNTSDQKIGRDLIQPCLKECKKYRRGTGTFASSAFKSYIAAIDHFVSDDIKIEILCSPKIDNTLYQTLLNCNNEEERDNWFKELADNIIKIASGVKDNPHDQDWRSLLIAYLIVNKKLEIKFAQPLNLKAIQRYEILEDEPDMDDINTRAMYHIKYGYFEFEDEIKVAFEGSVNETDTALSQNSEKASVYRSWVSGDTERLQDIIDELDADWNGENKNIKIHKIDDETLDIIKEHVQKHTGGKRPTNPKEKNQIEEIVHNPEEIVHSPAQKLKIPSYLNYEEGEYEHQGKAVKAWFDNQCKGILAIATGGGKTLTSLIAASKLNDQHENLFLIIGVPTRALLNQWAEDVKKFGVNPINTYGISNQKIKDQIIESLNKIKFKVSQCEVLIVTHEFLKSETISLFENRADQLTLMLIGDEVHNLGSQGFIEKPPNFFHYKLGLSATHERQFDEIGSDFLKDYFGEAVFEFSLEEAIGKCLVPYDYHLFKVFLTAEEEETFIEITHDIKSLSYAANLPDGDSRKDQWSNLCLKRRRLIETAENKIAKFKEVFEDLNKQKQIEKSLIFCTDKNNEQITAINNYLNSKSILWHQITGDETDNPKLLSSIIEDFRNNEYQVLTAMRVLDEGFNIPQTETAFLLSSNTVKRQWIQRLGRVLRLSPETNKTKAIIYDFVILPVISKNNTIDRELKDLIKSECKRILFFAQLSSNFMDAGGTYETVRDVLDSMESDDEYSN